MESKEKRPQFENPYDFRKMSGEAAKGPKFT